MTPWAQESFNRVLESPHQCRAELNQENQDLQGEGKQIRWCPGVSIKKSGSSESFTGSRRSLPHFYQTGKLWRILCLVSETRSLWRCQRTRMEPGRAAQRGATQGRVRVFLGPSDASSDP